MTSSNRQGLCQSTGIALQVVIRLGRVMFVGRMVRIWACLRLSKGLGHAADPANVILGRVELQGTRQVSRRKWP